jgi:YD repeat-containing protein
MDAVFDPSPDPATVARSDFNFDLLVDTNDLPGFVDPLLLGGPPAGQWTHSYSAHLVVETDQIHVVRDDGTVDVFASDGGGGYTAPPGIFSVLAADTPPADGYLLTTKAQAKVHFLSDGRLDYVEDPSGNRVTCTYINEAPNPADGKLDAVQDAAGRVLDLSYNTQGRLSTITDPISRQWRLLYFDGTDPQPPAADGVGPFVASEDPMSFRIAMTYTAAGAIETIADKNGNAWATGRDGVRV